MWLALVGALFFIHSQRVTVAAAVPDSTTFCSTLIHPLKIYDCELHTVSTKDGFKLGLHKVKTKAGATNVSESIGAILFLHSAVVDGGMWFSSPSPLPLSLAHLGFVTYIAHFRTTFYSQGHLLYKPTQKEYWDWCNDELSNYDFPALLQRVYELNNNKSIHVVGYSQGASAAIGAMSYQRVTKYRIESVVLLAPILYMRHVVSPILKVLGASNFGMVGYNAGLGEFALSILSKNHKNNDSDLHLALSTLTGPNCCVDNQSLYSIVTSPLSRTTYKSIAHVTQCIKLGNYQAFDHQNQSANFKVYGSSIPPSYSFQNVPKNISILVVHGGQDQLSSPKDVKYFTKLLPQPITRYLIKDYAHLDIIFSEGVEVDINKKVIAFLQENIQ